MNYNEFFNQVEANDLLIDIDDLRNTQSYRLSNEALFQLPLIAMIILLLSRNKRKPLIGEIGQLIGELLEQTMVGFKGSSQHLGWSANLRVRTVTAVSFLEYSKLIKVDITDNKLYISEVGKKIITNATSGDDDLAYTLAKIERAYRNFYVDKKIGMTLL